MGRLLLERVQFLHDGFVFCKIFIMSLDVSQVIIINV